MISLRILGLPAPKGSARAMLVKGKPVVIYSGSSANQRALLAWKNAVQGITQQQLGRMNGPLYVKRPLEVVALFRLPRPASHYGAKGLLPRAPTHHDVKPDGDKLLRSTLDALTGILFDDDSRVSISTAHKQWCNAGDEGCTLTVRCLDESRQLDLSARAVPTDATRG